MSSYNPEYFDPYEVPPNQEELLNTDLEPSGISSKEPVASWKRGSASDYFQDVLEIIIAISFLVLAIVVADLKDRTQTPWTGKVLDATKLAQSIWPIAFAAILGNALKSYAHWRLENGVKLGSLEQLMGSLTLGGTLQSPLTFRFASISTILLIILWSLSPLGSQAILRSAFIQDNNLTNASTITHYQTDIRAMEMVIISGYDYFMLSFQSADAWLQYANTSDNSSAAISFSNTISNLGGYPDSAALSAVDMWGNVRIPKLETLSEYNLDKPEKWLDVPWSDMVINYTSLIGIPFSTLDQSMASSEITMHAAYLDLPKCSSWENTPLWTNCTSSDQQNKTGCTPSGEIQAWMQSYYKTLLVHYEPEHDILQALENLFPNYNISGASNYINVDGGFFIDTITSWNTSVYLNPQDGLGPNFIFGILSPAAPANWETQLLSITRCSLSMKYYDVNITCNKAGSRPTRGFCAATAIRQSPNQNFTAAQHFLDATSIADLKGPTMNMTWNYLISTFPFAFGDFSPGDLTVPRTGSWMELLLLNPNIESPDFNDPSGQIADMPLDGIFRQRFELLLNTWFVSNTIGNNVLRGNSGKSQADLVCPGASLSNQTVYSAGYGCANQTMTFELPACYAISSPWIILFFIGDAIMVAAALVPLVLRRLRRGPDILGSVTSLTRDSLYFDSVERGPSTESSTDKALRLREVRVKLGYIYPSAIDQLDIIAFAPAEKVRSISKKG